MKSFFIIFCTLAVCLLTNVAFAQNNGQAPETEFARKPIWIGMMDDTSANFFMVEKAFDTYFKYHALPEGEHEEIGERRERLKKYSKRKQEHIQKENNLRMDVKRYYFWHAQTLPYVQGDGRILTPTERLAIWQAQRQTR